MGKDIKSEVMQQSEQEDIIFGTVW